MRNDGDLLHQKYDIFISFRGDDVRKNFLSHLYSYLKDRKKFTVYKDDVDLERGEQITPSLLQAIEGSTLYIVIFSPNYADSRWCLQELVKILKCRERYGRRVIPVFYGGVDPSHVRSQTCSYEAPFAGRYMKLPVEMSGEVQSWRAALTETANLAGFDSQVIWPETRLIEEISKAVFQAMGNQMMMPIPYSDRGLVGLEAKMQDMELLLSLDAGENRAIGLWGMGGIGKTTLAKAIHDRFSCQFESSYFLQNFADQLSHSPHMLGDLQRDLFSKLLGDESGGSRMPHDLILHRLGRTRSLVVIDDIGDDVGNIGQVKHLLNGQYCNLLGPGSRIVMTGRNKQLLQNACHQIYEVKALDYREALELFSSHAFKQDHPPIEYKEISMRAIGYAGGNPLALTVLGSHLYGKDNEFWDCELSALQHNPNPMVESVLRRSYNGLSKIEKDVFLDIACFYLYWSRHRFPKKLFSDEGCGNPIANLVDKSIISYRAPMPIIEMPGLLQDLGRSIVSEERRIEKRSRLWKVEDVCDIISQNKGSESIEGIFWGVERSLHLQPDTFSNMENLRFLMMCRGALKSVLPKSCLPNFTTKAILLPNALRILEWDSFPSKCLPSQFSPQNLVSLSLLDSKLEKLWKGADNVDLRNLKFLILSGSRKLRKLPNLSTATRLLEINLTDCVSLVELPTSILYLPKLEILKIISCTSLKLNNLEYYASGGGEQRGGGHPAIFPSLKILFLNKMPIQKVPSFITRSHILYLYCEGCSMLAEFPVIPSLKACILSGSLVKEVIELDKLTELRELDLSGCILLKEFPDISKTMDAASEDLTSSGCSSLLSDSGSIGIPIHLTHLDLSCTEIRELPSFIGDLTRLSKLKLGYCKSLARLPDTIHKLSNLDTLRLNNCDQLSHLPELPSSLTDLDARGCKSLQNLPIIDFVEEHNLSRMRMSWNFCGCRKLDPKECSKFVAKLIRLGPSAPSLEIILPMNRRDISSAGGGEGSTRGSDSKVEARVAWTTAKLRGRPWKLKSVIFCALLNHPPAIKNVSEYTVECLWVNNGNNDVVSFHSWRVPPAYGDDQVEFQYSNDLLVWSDEDYDYRTEPQLSNDKNHSTTFKFIFRGCYHNDLGKEYEIPDFIKTCRVIPVYDDRVVTYEGEDDNDDEDDQSGESILGLYMIGCVPACDITYKLAEDSVRSYGYLHLLLPRRQDNGNIVAKEERISGSTDRIVKADLRGQQWKSQSLIFCTRKKKG